MRLTTKGRYAVTAVLDLTLHEGRGPVSLAAISSRQHISLSYLEQLFAKLRKNEIVSSTRGPGGGYSLNRDARDINISEIILAVDDSYQAAGCEESGDCKNTYQCLTHDLWMELSGEIQNFLQGISLADIMSDKKVQEVTMRQDKCTQLTSAATGGNAANPVNPE